MASHPVGKAARSVHPGGSLSVPSRAIGSAAPALRERRRAFVLNWLAIGFIAPALAVVFLVSIYPVFDAALLSLFQTRYAQKLSFIGLDNYLALLRDPTVWNSVGNSLVFTGASLLLVLPLSIGLALLLNEPIPFRGAIRTIIILPWVVSQTVVALLWAWILNADFGPLTYGLELLLGQKLAILASPVGAMAALIGVNVWASYPQATLLLLAAVQTIPKELYEAARIDGSSGLSAFRYVTLPLIKSTILVVLIQLTLLYFNMVTLIYVFTGGGPLEATDTLALRVLKVSFEDWNLGRGAALGLLITICNLVFSIVYIRTLRTSRNGR
jgi:multiple sugar transport system permease protein